MPHPVYAALAGAVDVRAGDDIDRSHRAGEIAGGTRDCPQDSRGRRRRVRGVPRARPGSAFANTKSSPRSSTRCGSRAPTTTSFCCPPGRTTRPCARRPTVGSSGRRRHRRNHAGLRRAVHSVVPDCFGRAGRRRARRWLRPAACARTQRARARSRRRASVGYRDDDRRRPGGRGLRANTAARRTCGRAATASASARSLLARSSTPTRINRCSISQVVVVHPNQYLPETGYLACGETFVVTHERRRTPRRDRDQTVCQSERGADAATDARARTRRLGSRGHADRGISRSRTPSARRDGRPRPRCAPPLRQRPQWLRAPTYLSNYIVKLPFSALVVLPRERRSGADLRGRDARPHRRAGDDMDRGCAAMLEHGRHLPGGVGGTRPEHAAIGLAGMPRLVPHGQWTTLAAGLADATLVNADAIVDRQRAIKSEREIAQIRTGVTDRPRWHDVNCSRHDDSRRMAPRCGRDSGSANARRRRHPRDGRQAAGI